MWKKIVLIVTVLIVAIIGIYLFYTIKNKDMQIEKDTNIENITEISEKYVTDDCVNEWEDYAITKEKEIIEASKTISNENKTYILKAEHNIINIYFLNEKNEEVLYKVTDISTKYLGEEDVKKLEEGIEVKGSQELNQKLEDFE